MKKNNILFICIFVIAVLLNISISTNNQNKTSLEATIISEALAGCDNRAIEGYTCVPYGGSWGDWCLYGGEVGKWCGIKDKPKRSTN